MVGGGLVAKACLILETPWTVLPTRLLCPWDFPDRNTGAGSHFLFQGIFLTQGSSLRFSHLLHWQVGSLPLHHLVSPKEQNRVTTRYPTPKLFIFPVPR